MTKIAPNARGSDRVSQIRGPALATAATHATGSSARVEHRRAEAQITDMESEGGQQSRNCDAAPDV
jgi:hypothetical protein